MAGLGVASMVQWSMQSEGRVEHKPCAEIACSDADKFRQMLGRTPAPKAPKVAGPVWFKGADDCPPDRERLGRATWTFLHTTTAYLPERLDADDAGRIRALFDLVARLYPCVHCRANFEEDLTRAPPDFSSRSSIMRWLCEHHNRINAWHKAPTFPCTDEALLERYRTGAAPCHSADQTSASASLGQEDEDHKGGADV
jgi:FAD-linked sulfhydryl oxidase